MVKMRKQAMAMIIASRMTVSAIARPRVRQDTTERRHLRCRIEMLREQFRVTCRASTINSKGAKT